MYPTRAERGLVHTQHRDSRSHMHLGRGDRERTIATCAQNPESSLSRAYCYKFSLSSLRKILINIGYCDLFTEAKAQTLDQLGRFRCEFVVVGNFRWVGTMSCRQALLPFGPKVSAALP